MRITTLLLSALLSTAAAQYNYAQTTPKPATAAGGTLERTIMNKTIYDFKVTDIAGETFDMATLKGKKVMIVNTASKCGLTPQYELLEALYQKYRDSGFVIIGFPANDFAEQEPGTDQEIMAFCQKNYGVTFPMMSKISVKGEQMHPLYEFLTQQKRNGFADSEVQWNFQKYLIGRNGELEQVVGPKESPTSEAVLKWIAL